MMKVGDHEIFVTTFLVSGLADRKNARSPTIPAMGIAGPKLASASHRAVLHVGLSGVCGGQHQRREQG